MGGRGGGGGEGGGMNKIHQVVQRLFLAGGRVGRGGGGVFCSADEE